MSAMTISAAARAAGVGVETIRFYERQGLIPQPPKPRGGGYRSYPEETVQRIRFIREAQELGFTLREAAELLSLRVDSAADAGEVRHRVEIKLTDVEHKMQRLAGIRAALQDLLNHCPGRGPLECCSILRALDHTETGTEG